MCRWPKNARYLQPERLGPKMEVWSYGLAESQKERERVSIGGESRSYTTAAHGLLPTLPNLALSLTTNAQ